MFNNKLASIKTLVAMILSASCRSSLLGTKFLTKAFRPQSRRYRCVWPDPAPLKHSVAFSSAAEDLQELGALLAALSNPPDVLFLDGDLGAGKTTLAQGFILCKLGLDVEDSEHSLKVTSPTYLLSNTYCYQDETYAKEQQIHHMDLYRLKGTSSTDFDPLHLDHVFKNCISLVEWPTRLSTTQPQLLPPNKHRLDVEISILPQSETRVMTLFAPTGSTWSGRLQTVLEEGMLDDLLLEDDINDHE